MKILAAFVAIIAVTAIPPSISGCGSTAYEAAAQRSCCRACSKGKACGNSCIARHLNCHKGRGCACNSR